MDAGSPAGATVNGDVRAFTESDILPRCVLIAGVDAAGKDHVANIVEEMMVEAGHAVERRKHVLAGRRSAKGRDRLKTRSELLLERLFLLLFPLLGWMLPWVAEILLRRDIADFLPPQDKLVIVGHNYLRGLAFYWGHRHRRNDEIVPSAALHRTLARMGRIEGMQVIVLKIDREVRRRRIAQRIACGEADNFDLYMFEHLDRAERIEEVLAWLVETYLDAQVIENNDLPAAELRRRLNQGFARSAC